VAFALGVAAFLVTVAVFFLFIVWLKPLGQLRTFAQRISQGDYGQPVPIRSGGEVGELADELNKMAQRLKEREEMIRRQAGELLRADRFSTIGKMATQIAHEIRNPLNALGLKLELLEDSIEEARTPLEAATYEKLRREFEAAGKEIDRLREITDYYLKFAKFPKVEKENVDVSVVLFDLVAFYEDEAQRKGVRVERELERPLWASLDPNLLRHAVANLLRNAIDAACEAQEGAGKVWVKAWKENQELRIVVKDNGPGIPAESLLRVFEPFYSTKKSGTGLGLTLVQQVVTEHGGQVVCSSAPNEGASFRISIPA
jgi:signal transduction histidine kinase